MRCVGLHFVIVVFPDHTHLLLIFALLKDNKFGDPHFLFFFLNGIMNFNEMKKILEISNIKFVGIYIFF